VHDLTAAENNSVGAVVLSYGHGGQYEQLLDDLLHDQHISPQQVVVVHNPIDATDAWSPSLPDGVTLLRLPENRGYAGGMNAGVAAQLGRGAKWLLLLTHDARLRPRAVSELRAMGESQPSAGVLGPLLYLADGSLWSAGVISAAGIARHDDEWDTHAAVVDKNSVDGTVLMIRAQAYLDAGGFDERFFMYWEEAEFCLRCTRAGWRVLLVPSAAAVTSPGRARRPAAHAYLQTRNGLEYARRQGGLNAVFAQGVDVLHSSVRDLPHPIRTKWRDRDAWQYTTDRWIGTLIGILDFGRRRWGLPPTIVRRRGDVGRAHGRS